jgi:radical SAM protein with 4Fe4S-binding SPASM domain
MLELHITELGPDRPGPYGNYRLNLAETRARATHLRSKPVHVQIETTTKCNLGCIQCGLHSYALKGRDFDLEALESLGRDLFETAGSVIFSDTGEALLYRGISRVFDLVGRYGIPIGGFFTNGTYLDEATVRRIVESGMAFVNVSIDGGSKQTFERIRPGADFGEVIAGLRRLCAERERHNGRLPVVQVNCVGMTDNLEEFPQLVRLAASAGADRVVCSNLVPYTYELQEHSLVHAGQRVQRIRAEALELGERLGVYVGFPEPTLPAMERPRSIEGAEVFDDPVAIGRNGGEVHVPLAALSAIDPPKRAVLAEFLQFPVEVSNLSGFRFRCQGSPVIGQVWLSYHWVDEQGEPVVFDGLRSPLGEDLGPGDQRRVLCTVRTPERPGLYGLVLDLVREGVRWFGDRCQRPELSLEIEDRYALSYFPPPLGHCEYPWKYLSIKVGGDVYPCCWLSKPLGNVLRQSVEQIWNGDRYQRLRSSIADGSYSVCRGAHCPYSSLTPPNAFRATIETLELPGAVRVGEPFQLRVRVRNDSVDRFKAHGDDFDNVVWLAYHWVSEAGTTLVFDGLRTSLGTDLEPGASTEVMMIVAPPGKTGRHRLVLDLVVEGATWFSQAGNPPTELMVEVTRLQGVAASPDLAGAAAPRKLNAPDQTAAGSAAVLDRS